MFIVWHRHSPALSWRTQSIVLHSTSQFNRASLSTWNCLEGLMNVSDCIYGDASVILLSETMWKRVGCVMISSSRRMERATLRENASPSHPIHVTLRTQKQSSQLRTTSASVQVALLVNVSVRKGMCPGSKRPRKKAKLPTMPTSRIASLISHGHGLLQRWYVSMKTSEQQSHSLTIHAIDSPPAPSPLS